MITDSLIICYSTPNYEKLVTMFKSSLYSIGVKDENIKHKLDIPTDNLLSNTGFQTPLWYFCAYNKLKHLQNMLEEYKNKPYKYIIFSDCDIQFFAKNKQEWSSLEKYIIESTNDIFFMRDDMEQYTLTDVNGGFYIIKNNNNINTIIDFFSNACKLILETPIEKMPYGDQNIINNIKNTVNYGFIPNEYIVYGTKIFNKNMSLFHHAICTKDVSDKIEQMDLVRDFFSSNI